MPSRRVLVVDDEADIRAVIQGCLEDIAGWKVILANSGEQCLEIAEKEQLDGILMDVTMPGIGGIEALQQLQENAYTKTIPVALLTAKVLPDEQKEFASLGIVGLIIKPFDPMTLVDRVSRVFGWKD
ncbi:response regulator [Aerosakkonemataceae cyanobacterium BLCC-F50]|uniref:Response regulator n=1 Tax=Floridaenema flaviceps BLCC-F50 TaxID=3153642 RepID=A0ABV4Y3F0_9CYAN